MEGLSWEFGSYSSSDITGIGNIKLASTGKYTHWLILLKEIGTTLLFGNLTFPYPSPCNETKLIETLCALPAACNHTTAPY